MVLLLIQLLLADLYSQSENYFKMYFSGFMALLIGGKALYELNVMCCVGRVEIQIEI